jgi:hypothetical protein
MKEKVNTVKRCVIGSKLSINLIFTEFADISLFITKKGTHEQFITLAGNCVFWDIAIEVINSVPGMHKNERRKLRQERRNERKNGEKGENKAKFKENNVPVTHISRGRKCNRSNTLSSQKIS